MRKSIYALLEDMRVRDDEDIVGETVLVLGGRQCHCGLVREQGKRKLRVMFTDGHEEWVEYGLDSPVYRIEDTSRVAEIVRAVREANQTESPMGEV